MVHVIFLLSLLSMAGVSVDGAAEELQCQDGAIVVHGAEPEDVRDGCKAARSVARFFGSAGMPVPRNVKITIVDAQPSTTPGMPETGNYDARRNTIHVLAYQSAVKATESNEAGLGRIATRSHWRSYIAHELAHAAIHTGCDSTCPSRAIHEYVAAVAQIASLPGDERADLLAPYRDLEPFHQLSEITDTYYAINPHYFAVKSYKHYQQQHDPRSFFRSVLQLSH